jgi:outer membrane beta-barrel protein
MSRLMSRRLWLALTLALAPLAAHAQSGEEAEAGDVSEVDRDRLGPLRERVRPVSGHLFLKRGRFEFSPSATLSLRDAFFRKYVFGGTLTYHPWETLGFSVRAGYSKPTVSGAASICTVEGTARDCASPAFSDLDGVGFGQIKFIGGLDVQWAPIYGKLSLLSEYFAHFDMYAVAGGSMVQYGGPREAGQGVSKATWTPGANVGVGLRFFLNRWLTLRTEMRDLIYSEQTELRDSSGTGDRQSSLRNQLLFELGVSIFLPTVLPES